MDKLNDYCCSAIKLWIDDKNCPLYYSPMYRDYGFSAPESLMPKNVVWPCYPVLFCPLCGTKLPEDLVEKRMDLLKQYGIDDPFDDKQNKLIPHEFHTDEWWKKRGL